MEGKIMRTKYPSQIRYEANNPTITFRVKIDEYKKTHDWLAAIAGIVAKSNLKKPFVFHFHSTEEGRTSNGSHTVKQIERVAGDHADLIITVSYAMRDELMRLGYPESKIRVVYNGVDPIKYDPGHFSEKQVNDFRERIESETRRKCIHSCETVLAVQRDTRGAALCP
jgi:glycosyltransferase involved in cell wall biosynthesis